MVQYELIENERVCLRSPVAVGWFEENYYDDLFEDIERVANQKGWSVTDVDREYESIPKHECANSYQIKSRFTLVVDNRYSFIEGVL